MFTFLLLTTLLPLTHASERLNRSPAIDGPATEFPVGENAHLYENLGDREDEHPDDRGDINFSRLPHYEFFPRPEIETEESETSEVSNPSVQNKF